MGTSTIPSLVFSRTLDKELDKQVRRACSLSVIQLQRVQQEVPFSEAKSEMDSEGKADVKAHHNTTNGSGREQSAAFHYKYTQTRR